MHKRRARSDEQKGGGGSKLGDKCDSSNEKLKDKAADEFWQCWALIKKDGKTQCVRQANCINNNSFCMRHARLSSHGGELPLTLPPPIKRPNIPQDAEGCQCTLCAQPVKAVHDLKAAHGNDGNCC